MLKRFEENETIISIDSIFTPMWSGGINTLTNFATHESSSTPSPFFINISSTNASNPIEFSISYAHKNGADSSEISDGVNASQINYKRYQNLILGSLLDHFTFGETNVDDFFIINLQRSNYKEKIRLGSFSITINGTTIIDNTSEDETFITTEAGRAYNLTNNIGEWDGNTSYGWLLPDIGIILLNSGVVTIDYPTTRPEVTLRSNITSFTLTAEESISSIYAFIRAGNKEFNYTENPSFTDEEGEVLIPYFINNPQTYITSVGFYNDNNELLAVAKLSKPLPKNFTKEALIRAKIVY